MTIDAERFTRDLLTDASTTLWQAPTLADLTRLVEQAGLNMDEVMLTGWEAGGLQVFLTNQKMAELGIELEDEHALS